MFVLALSYVAAFIMWLVAVLQSILYYSEIAVAPIFVPFLMVRGLENIAKSFLLSFFAICLWPLCFLVTGLLTQFLIGLAVNSGNNAAVGAANASGMTYLWMIGVSIWVIFGATIGPWWVSKRFVAGASGMADMVVGAQGAAARVYHVGSNSISSILNGSGGGYIAPPSSSRSMSPNYATRPMSKPPEDEKK
jgi:hypothetical protein